VVDAPALLLVPAERRSERTLVVADVHLGLGSTPERPLGPPEAAADRLAEELVLLAKREGASSVLIAGDVKHPIVGTPPALRPVVFDFFGRILEGGLRAEVVLGNHDVGLVRHLPREVDVHPAAGVVRDGVGVFHGHRWPSNPVLRSGALVAGHLHPGFRLAPTADDPEGKRRCWVRVELPPPGPRPKRRRRHADLRAREVVILPPFNPLAGVEALNRERPRRGRSFLYARFLGRGEMRAYLLDGTDLGLLPRLPAVVHPTEAAERGRRGR
jgi:uncharacterized protein